MREIELKLRVRNLEDLLLKIKKMDCEIGSPIFQNDTIYISDLKNTKSNEESVWLRIRKENEKIELNYKKQSAFLEESQEIEFEVNSYEKAKEFLEALGYKKWVEVNKKRCYSKYLNYNLCIDEVERLGSFIEIEIVVEENDTKNYIEDLLSVAEELGLNKEDIVKSHYDTMISQLDKESID